MFDFLLHRGITNEVTSNIPSKITISSTDIKDAVKDSFYKEIPDRPNQTGPTEVRMNAFDLASQYVMGSISKMATGQDGTLIKRQTRLVTKGKAEEIMERMFEILKEEKANPKFKGTSLLKCFVNLSDSVITLNVALTKTVSDDLSILEFRRGKGNFLAFHSFFRHVAGRMKEYVISQVPAQQIPLETSSAPSEQK